MPGPAPLHPAVALPGGGEMLHWFERNPQVCESPFESERARKSRSCVTGLRIAGRLTRRLPSCGRLLSFHFSFAPGGGPTSWDGWAISCSPGALCATGKSGLWRAPYRRLPPYAWVIMRLARWMPGRSVRRLRLRLPRSQSPAPRLSPSCPAARSCGLPRWPPGGVILPRWPKNCQIP